MCNNFVKIYCVLLLFIATSYCYTPVVLWHGITDTCCGDTITGIMQKELMEHLPGIHVVSIQIGNSPVQDYINSIFMHPDKQIQIACDIIRSDPLLAKGYHGVGYSQGGQFLRGVAQRCPEVKMRTLVSMAGQHQGIYGVPRCNLPKLQCELLRRTANKYMYLDVLQKLVTPATYWQNPLDRDAYLKGSTFLADLNNEKFINETYINNLQALENFVMVKYLGDKTVVPQESEWFGFYKSGQSRRVLSLQETELYISDRLGLKRMEEARKLHFLNTTWDHKEFHWPWFRDNIVDKFFV